MLERHQLKQCTTAQSPYRSSTSFDRINHDAIEPQLRQRLVKEYQSLIVGVNWLSINTPDINTVYNLLSQFNCSLSKGHLESAKYVLCFLKHTSFHGIWFKQGENRLQGSVLIPEELKGNDLMVFIDSNWDPKDASKPKPKPNKNLHRNYKRIEIDSTIFCYSDGGSFKLGSSSRK